MAQQTTLSPLALPGKPYSFSAKTEATIPKGAGPFTELSVTATPGQIHSFSAKDEAVTPPAPHTGLFTELSVMALPGMRHSFSAKAEAPEEEYYGERQQPTDDTLIWIPILTTTMNHVVKKYKGANK